MAVLALCFILVGLCLIKYILHVRNVDNYVKDLKTLPRVPLIGNVAFFMGKSLQEVYEEFIRVILKNGTPFKAQIGPAFFILLDQPEDVKKVMMSQDCLNKPYIYDFIHSPFSLLGQRCKIIQYQK